MTNLWDVAIAAWEQHKIVAEIHVAVPALEVQRMVVEVVVKQPAKVLVIMDVKGVPNRQVVTIAHPRAIIHVQEAQLLPHRVLPVGTVVIKLVHKPATIHVEQDAKCPVI